MPQPERRRRERRRRKQRDTHRLNRSEKTTGFFWHLTDGHINADMPTDANPCDSCLSSMGQKKCDDLEPVGRFGHALCDASIGLWRSAVDHMRRVAPLPDFILAGGDWLGKAPRGLRDGGNSMRAAAVLIATMLNEAFPHVPTLHAMGNHDTYPYMSTAPTWRGWETAWRADAHLGDEYMSQQFPDDALAQWRKHGYYSRTLWRPQASNTSVSQPAIHGIALNTNDLVRGDAREQLDWLERTLGTLRAQGDTALLLGHIPPGPSHFELDSICSSGHYFDRTGSACWAHGAQRRFVELATKFADVLPASFFGHHHTDSVRVIGTRRRARRDRAVATRTRAPATGEHIAFLAAALTPRNPPHDPSLRLYSYSRLTGQILDFRDFSLNVPNSNRHKVARWVEAPSALHCDALNLTSLAPAEWERALSSMLAFDHRPRSTDELHPADPFFSWVSQERCTSQAYVESGPMSVPPLRKCKLAHVCAALHVDDKQYAECIGMPLH